MSRTGGFEQHSIRDWWLAGWQALVPSALLSATFLVLAWLATTVIRLVRGSKPRQGRSGLRERLMPGGDLSKIAQLFVIAQFVAIVTFCWAFFDLLWAVVVDLNMERREILSVLDPNRWHVHVYFIVSVVLLATAVMTWTVLIIRRSRRQALEVAPMMVGLGLTVVLLLFPTVPWRLKAKVPRTDIEDLRCYEVGRRDDRLMLFCPDAEPPRIKTPLLTDPALRRGGASYMFESKARAAVLPKDPNGVPGNGGTR